MSFDESVVMVSPVLLGLAGCDKQSASTDSSTTVPDPSATTSTITIAIAVATADASTMRRRRRSPRVHPRMAEAAMLRRPDRFVAMMLAAGAGQTCAQSCDGKTRCWGDTGHLKMLDGASNMQRARPTSVPPLDGVREMSHHRSVEAANPRPAHSLRPLR